MSVQGMCVGHLATEHKGQQPWEQHDEKGQQVTCSGAKRGNRIATERTHQDIWGEGHCPAHVIVITRAMRGVHGSIVLTF